MKIVETNFAALEKFMTREWAPENSKRFGRNDPAMWVKHSGYLGAYENDELVGAAIYYTQAGVGHLSELLVSAEQRGSGIGSALLDEFEQRARAAGCHKLTLKTYWDEKAVAFYRQHGYAVEAILYREVFGIDMCRMAKFVDGEPVTDEGH